MQFRRVASGAMVTDRRVLYVDGVLRKNSVDAGLNMITDVGFRQGVLGRTLDYGDLVVATASNRPLHFRQIRDASCSRVAIMAAQHATVEARADEILASKGLGPASVAPMAAIATSAPATAVTAATTTAPVPPRPWPPWPGTVPTCPRWPRTTYRRAADSWDTVPGGHTRRVRRVSRCERSGRGRRRGRRHRRERRHRRGRRQGRGRWRDRRR
ncbi:MAG: PH domain-containing protein [Chloroflexota bacterium]